MAVPTAAIVVLLLVGAATAVLLAMGYLFKRVQALKAEVAGLSAQLDGPLRQLQGDATVTQAELSSLRDSLEGGAGNA